MVVGALGNLGEDRVGDFLVTLADRFLGAVDDPGVGLVGDDQGEHLRVLGKRVSTEHPSVTPLQVHEVRLPQGRDRTMQAVVDWSYGLLSQDEQRFFRALGMFTGGFTVAAAAAVAMGDDAIDRLADLVAKSLVVADASGIKPRFRLVDTTRAYAIDNCGRLRASVLTAIGWCCPRCSRVCGRPRPVRDCGGMGALPGGHTDVLGPIPAT